MTGRWLAFEAVGAWGFIHAFFQTNPSGPGRCDCRCLVDGICPGGALAVRGGDRITICNAFV
jgi:hypothetical protein